MLQILVLRTRPCETLRQAPQLIPHLGLTPIPPLRRIHILLTMPAVLILEFHRHHIRQQRELRMPTTIPCSGQREQPARTLLKRIRRRVRHTTGGRSRTPSRHNRPPISMFDFVNNTQMSNSEKLACPLTGGQMLGFWRSVPGCLSGCVFGFVCFGVVFLFCFVCVCVVGVLCLFGLRVVFSVASVRALSCCWLVLLVRCIWCVMVRASLCVAGCGRVAIVARSVWAGGIWGRWVGLHVLCVSPIRV